MPKFLDKIQFVDSSGELITIDSDVVKITGNQIISGNKTFTGTTVIQKAPEDLTDAARKMEIDKAMGNCIKAEFLLDSVTGLTVTLNGTNWFEYIDWGDGVIDSLSSHTYSVLGTYTCYIYGITTLGVADTGFLNCDALINITIPNGTTRIGDSAFSGCTTLTNIKIPDSLTNIGSQAFLDCNLLESITMGNNVTDVGAQAFSGCDSLVVYYQGASIPSTWSSNFNPDERPVYYNCTNVDLSKYTIIKTTDPSVQGTDGVIVLVTSA